MIDHQTRTYAAYEAIGMLYALYHHGYLPEWTRPQARDILVKAGEIDDAGAEVAA